jgi:hypothetical protein
MTDPHDALIERGVSREVAAERGYTPYYGKHHPEHDPVALARELSQYDLTGKQRRFFTSKTSGARDADFPDGDFDPKEDREEHAGLGQGLLMHKHPFPGEPKILPQLRPEHAVELDARGQWHRHDLAYRHTSEHLQRHLKEEHAGWPVDDNEWHRHPAGAKYLNAPRTRERREHDHATDPRFQGPNGRRNLIAHLAAKYRRGDHGLTLTKRHSGG